MQDEITQTNVMLIPMTSRFTLAKHLAHKTLRLAGQKFWLVLLTTVLTTLAIYFVNEIRTPLYQTEFSFTITEPTAELTGAEFDEIKPMRRDKVLQQTLAGLKSKEVLKRLLQHQRVINALTAEKISESTAADNLLERLSSALSIAPGKTPQTYRLITTDRNPQLAHAIANILPQIHNDQIHTQISPKSSGQSSFQRHRRQTQARFALLDKAPRQLLFNRSFTTNDSKVITQKLGQQERLDSLKSEIQALQLLIDAPENATIENVTDSQIVSIYRDIVVNKVKLQVLLKAKTATAKKANLLRRHITSSSVELSHLAQVELIEKRAQFVGLMDFNHSITAELSFVKPVFITDEVLRLASITPGSLSALSRIKPLFDAELPQNPILPNKKQGLILGFVGGFFFGIILASFIGFKDEKITEIEDLENEFKLPILGILPQRAEVGV